MQYEYFHPGNADQFAFYRVPKRLFTDQRMQQLSFAAKLLYGMMLDRVCLSTKNGWVDETGLVYIIYTQQEIMENLGISDKTATKFMNELLQYGLVEKRIQGLGRPALLYVKNFAADSDDLRVQTRKISDSGPGKITSQDSENLRTNNTNHNNTEMSNPILSAEETDDDPGDLDPDARFYVTGSAEAAPDGNDEMDRQNSYEIYFKNQISYDELLKEFPYRKDELDGIVALLVDVASGDAKRIRVSGDNKPANVVRGQLMKLNADHIRYVMQCMRQNTTEIKNMKQYLLTALYNAPITIGHHYQAQVNADMAEEVITNAERTA